MRRSLLLLLVLLFVSACGAPSANGGPSALPAATATPTETSLTPGPMPCQVMNPALTPRPTPTEQAADRGHALGPADAPVTIVVFSDYQCPACAYVAQVLKEIQLMHPNDVRLVYYHSPLGIHDKALLAIQAVEAADLQGKFWEMHDLLFQKRGEWVGLAPADFPAWAEKQAAGLGLDAARFQTDFQGPVVAERTAQAVSSASAIQQSIPLLFINSSTPYSGQVDLAGLDQVVSLLALSRRQFNACPPMTIDPLKQYLASLHTSRGDIVLQLYADKSPLAVNNFVFLARAGWYDGITFHRVLPGVLAMTGDPSGSGLGNPGYLFPSELPLGLHFDHPGVVAMSNTGPDTNGSQFFITQTAAPQLEGQYTIFGQVLSGQEVLSALSARDPTPGQFLPPGDALIRVTITEH